MNAPTKPPEAAEATDLIAVAAQNPVAILTDAERFDAFYAKVKAEVDAHVPDLTTDKGRKAIASLAYKVAKTKTALDDAGKKLTEDKRKEIAAVDEARRNIRAKLDALRDEARRPLTEWEAAEEARQAKAKAAREDITAAAVVILEDTSASVEERLSRLEAMTLDADLFGDDLPIAKAEWGRAVETLQLAHARLLKEEADRAELERLRQEAAEREAREAAERERQEREAAEARAKAEAEERARKAAEEAAAAAQRAAEEAAAQAKAEAERKAREEQEARDRAHQEALAAERKAREEAEAKAKTEQERREREEREAKAKADAEAAAKAKREADIAHKSKILRAAKEAVMEHAAVGEPEAKAVVQAIASGLIPNITVSF